MSIKHLNLLSAKPFPLIVLFAHLSLGLFAMNENIQERLQGAAQAGDIDELYAIIRENPYILESIDQKPFFDTPLHIAAAEGHTDFASEIMNLKPSLALKLNPDGFSPIHLALQNGEKARATVLDLLGMDKNLLRVKGKGGKTPLHYVVGEADVDLDLLLTFLLCCPECIRDVTNQNETALHIAAQNNQFRVLQVLVGWLRRTHHKDGKIWEKEVLNWRNKGGDTVLHIAVSNNQPKMVKFLLESGIDKNAKNWRGLTAKDLRGETRPQNRVTSEILQFAGCLNASSILTKPTSDKFLRSKISFSEKSNIVISRMRKNILNSTRNALLVVLVLILTATYQSAVNPPYKIVDFPDSFKGKARLGPFTLPNNEPPSEDLIRDNERANIIGDYLHDYDMVKIDLLALLFSIFNAVEFMVTLLVTLLILPWVPNGRLLHVLLLLAFIFFVTSMGLSLAITTSAIGMIVFCFFVLITIIAGIFIVKNKVKSRKVYRECIKDFADRVRIRKPEDIKRK